MPASIVMTTRILRPSPVLAGFLGSCLASAAMAQAPLHVTSSIPIGVNATEFTSDDWNGDGLIDYAVGHVATVSVALSVCPGVYAPPVEYALQPLALSQLRNVGSGDLDGDGLPEIVVVRAGAFPAADSVITVLPNLGAGVFGPAVDHAVIVTNVQGSAITPTDVVVADMNGDGLNDVAVSASQLNIPGQPGYFCISLNLTTVAGNIVLANSVNIDTNRETAEAITAFDQEGDGDMDLAICNRLDNDVSVFTNDGSGVAGGVDNETLTGANTAPIRLAHGDLNNDGRVDLVALNVQGHTYSVIRNRGGGQWADQGQFPLGSQVQPFPHHATGLALADVDGDGNVDLLAGIVGDRGNPGYLAVLPGNGNLRFGTEQQFAVGPFCNRVIARDYDNDGDIDVAVANTTARTVTKLENTLTPTCWQSLGHALPGSTGVACLDGTGVGAAGTSSTLRLRNAPPGLVGFMLMGPARANLPFAGGLVVPDPTPPLGIVFAQGVDTQGSIDVNIVWPAIDPGFSYYFQWWMIDSGAAQGFSSSNAIRSVAP